MASGIYAATAGAVAQSNALDVTANNISNANTTAFKGARVAFRQAMAAAQSVDVAMVGAGTGGVDTTNGALTQTGNPLDVAIDGDGYLAVDTPRGVRYTRDGALQLDDQGMLVTAGGLRLRGDGGPIQIPPGTAQVAIEPDGTVHADDSVVGKLQLVHLAPGSETRDGDQLIASRAAPLAGPPPRLVSGVLEGSNVNVVRGVVDLVKVSRSYESLLKIIQGYHDVEARAAREIGGK